jgi:hypothetical protein
MFRAHKFDQLILTTQNKLRFRTLSTTVPVSSKYFISMDNTERANYSKRTSCQAKPHLAQTKYEPITKTGNPSRKRH